MFAEVYNIAGIGNMQGIAKFLVAPVAILALVLEMAIYVCVVSVDTRLIHKRGYWRNMMSKGE
jgi:hypothetical protein